MKDIFRPSPFSYLFHIFHLSIIILFIINGQPCIRWNRGLRSSCRNISMGCPSRLESKQIDIKTLNGFIPLYFPLIYINWTWQPGEYLEEYLELLYTLHILPSLPLETRNYLYIIRFKLTKKSMMFMNSNVFH